MKRFCSLSIFFIILSTNHSFGGSQDLFCAEESPYEKFQLEIFDTLGKLKVCPTMDEIILKDVTKEFEKNYGNKNQVSQNIKGATLKGSQEEIKIAKKLLGEKPPEGWAEAAAECESVLCAFEKLLASKEAAMQLFNIPAKSGYVLSLDQKINQGKVSQAWSPKEIRELDAAINKLPPELKELTYLSEVNRMGDNLRLHSHTKRTAAFARAGIRNHRDGELVIYDSGMDFKGAEGNPYDSISWPQEVLLHELCHHHDFKGYYATRGKAYTSEQNPKGFREISSWDEIVQDDGSDKWQHDSQAKFISEYAKTSPAEDYAESCMNYILHPESLKEMAPEKYTFMKTQVFQNIEYGDSPWRKVKWPAFKDLLADESTCSEDLNECFKELKYLDGTFSMPGETKKTDSGTSTMIYSSNNINVVIKKNHCISQNRRDRLKAIQETLLDDPDYCEYGGEEFIKSQEEKICSKTKDSLVKSIEKASTRDLLSIIAGCETSGDYTHECISKIVTDEINPPKENIPAIEALLNSRIPDRILALEKQAQKIPTAKWLKSCMKQISSIQKFDSYDNDMEIKTKFYYEAHDEKFRSGYLGENISRAYQLDDINMSCALTFLDHYTEAGYQTPKIGNPTKLLTNLVQAEIKSFETEVLLQINDVTSKCLLNGCKVSKVSELIETWVNKSPLQRGGLVDDDFTTELLDKIK